jgi:acyl carrier protein phosphodiesterase
LNYLAHIFLSGENRQLQVGNFIGDFVKGKQFLDYPSTIQKGVIFHREIDTFTDSHPLFLEIIALLQPTFGRYSGIMADMFLDYLLASNFKNYYPDKNLNCFSYNFYLSAFLNYKWLPDKVKGFIFHFISTNRLKKYETYGGLRSSLQIMATYKSDAIKPKLSIQFLQENEPILKNYFEEYMPQLIQFSDNYKASELEKI